MTLAGGECFGSGMEPGDDGLCPECGRRIGFAHGSGRLACHKPTVTTYERKRARAVGDPTDFGRIAARLNVAAWIGEERRAYADVKYDRDGEVWHKLLLEMRNYGYAGEWEVFVTNYLSRVKLFGLDTEAGRQQCGKLIVTLTSMLEAATQVHGPLPAPGVPSGEIHEWVR